MNIEPTTINWQVLDRDTAIELAKDSKRRTVLVWVEKYYSLESITLHPSTGDRAVVAAYDNDGDYIDAGPLYDLLNRDLLHDLLKPDDGDESPRLILWAPKPSWPVTQ